MEHFREMQKLPARTVVLKINAEALDGTDRKHWLTLAGKLALRVQGVNRFYYNNRHVDGAVCQSMLIGS